MKVFYPTVFDSIRKFFFLCLIICTSVQSWGEVPKVTAGDAPASVAQPAVQCLSTGTTWIARTAAESNGWRSVAYGNGVFVAVALDGTNRVMTSPDGITWTARAAAAVSNWYYVTYGNGLFVAVANIGTTRVMTSPDGITWTPRTAAEANDWGSVTYGNGLFVAVAVTGTNRVMTSPDGITWTARAATGVTTRWNSVTYGNGLFVAVGTPISPSTTRVMTSPDGINWTARTEVGAAGWACVTYGNGLFVAVGINRVMTSPDGINWTARTAAESNTWIEVTYGNGLFVAVAFDGTNRVMTSPDGITWTARAAAANSWVGVTFGNNIFVAVGANSVMTSTIHEINLQGGSPLANIPDGDNAPTAAKGTDFGNVNVGSNEVKTFTIQNTGGVPLNISSISSSNGLYAVSGLALPTTITAGGSATFTVTFSPTTTGAQNTTITVNNDDCDEAVYDFAVTGNGACPAITINAPTVTQPTCTTPTGTIVVNATGSGTLEYSINNGSTWQSSNTYGGQAAGNYNLKVRSQATPSCEVTYASNPVVLTSPFTASTTTDTWTGCVSTNWATPSNWADGSVPTAVDDVVLPNTTNKPSIVGGTAAVAKTIEVQTGTTLTIAAMASLTVNGSKTISGNTVAFFNGGTVTNSGQVAIGSSAMADVGKYGIRNEGTFNNSTGGNIQIDRWTDTGLYNEAGSFTNSGNIIIGALAATGKDGLFNGAIFSNTGAGLIQIDRSFSAGISNLFSATFTNSASITIGSLASVGTWGLLNLATFNNNTGGDIKIDNAGDGIENRNIFNNNTGGQLTINRSTGFALENFGTLDNSGTIRIGNITSVANRGIVHRNGGTLNNKTGGLIQIDRTSAVEAFFTSGVVNNEATIEIGSNAAVTGLGLYIDSGTGIFNNKAGSLLTINRSTKWGMENKGTLDNSGTIRVGNIASVGAICIVHRNGGTFINKTGGAIYMDRTTAGGQALYSSGLFNNQGAIKIGSNADLSGEGIRIDGNTFNNEALIEIGSQADVKGYGIRNGGGSTFNNKVGGEIRINRIGILNTGVIGAILNIGTFTNDATITVGNIGLVSAQDGILNLSNFTNNAAGVISIEKTWGNGIWNSSGTFQNAGKITIRNVFNYFEGTYSTGILSTVPFTNSSGAEIHLDQVANGIISTRAFTNAGLIRMGENGPLTGSGIANVQGVNAVFNNNAGGDISIKQTAVDGVQNDALSTFNNNACAKLTIFDNLNNAGTFTNLGLFTVNTTQAHTNTALTNNGVIEYPQGNPIPNVTNNDVIIAPISTCGVLTPALQIGGSNDFTVGGTWYKDANMTVAAGTYSGNTFTVTDLTVGAHTLYFTVTNPANACPRTVGINVTVNPASVGGTVGAAQTICAGTSPADLTLTGNTGNVVKWQKSTDLAFTSPTDIASTSTTLTSATIGNLTTNTYFRAVVKNGVCDEVNSEAVLITVNQQEINLQGGSPLTNIPDGDNTPTAAKGTDFGSFEVIGNVIKTFTVQNTGSTPLNISSIVSNNALFTVGALSPASPIAAGGSATFTVTFSPTATGVQNATITVNNNDCDEAVYDFAVTGNAVCPAIVINAPTVTQSTCTTPTGTIVVNATGSGTLEYSIDNGSNWQSSATFGGLAAGNYNIKVRSQAFPTCTTTYASNPVVITLKTPPSVDAGSCKFVYNGYGSNCTNLTASATGAAGGFTYSWSPGNLSGAMVQVCPTVTTTYTVTVTDANGCTSTDEVTVEVIDVRCGNSNANEKVLVCFGGKSLCVAPTAVPALLANGATLGACGITPCGTQSNARLGVESDEATRPMALMMQVYPNPTAGLVTVDLRNVSKGLARIEVVDLIGRPLVQKAEQMNEGANQLSFDLNQLPDGLYLIRCRDSQNHEAVVKVNKL